MKRSPGKRLTISSLFASIDLDLIVVTLVSSVVILIAAKRAPFRIWDEALYCSTTRDMLVNHQYLYPTRNGVFSEWYGKPPLANWLEIVSTSLFGWNLLALRLLTA